MQYIVIIETTTIVQQLKQPGREHMAAVFIASSSHLVSGLLVLLKVDVIISQPSSKNYSVCADCCWLMVK